MASGSRPYWTRISRPPSRAARAAVIFAWTGLTVLLYAIAAHWLEWIGLQSFLWSLAASWCIALLALILSWRGLYMLWHSGARAGGNGLKAMLVSVFTLLPLFGVIVLGIRLPALNQISTDLFDPPSLYLPSQEAGGVWEGPISPEMAERQLAAYPSITSRIYDVTLDNLAEIVTRQIQDNGWTVQSQKTEGIPNVGYEFLVDAKTGILNLPSHVTIRLRPRGEGSIIDMRAVSNFSAHDFGLNARLIEEFMNSVDEAIETTGVT